MEACIVACGIFQPELELVLEQIKAEQALEDGIEIAYVAPALHVDYDRLKEGITAALDAVTADRTVLLFGSMCHPEIGEFTEHYGVVRPTPGNCVELILGKERMQEIEKSARVFYLTPGWLQNWDQIFRQGQGWDDIDARQNFGFYDKILLLDTGVGSIEDDAILSFFEYTQVPIEIEKVELTNFQKNVTAMLKTALAELPAAGAAGG